MEEATAGGSLLAENARLRARLAEVEAEKERLREKNERVVRQMDAELKRKPSVSLTIVAYWVAQLRGADTA